MHDDEQVDDVIMLQVDVVDDEIADIVLIINDEMQQAVVVDDEVDGIVVVVVIDREECLQLDIQQLVDIM